MTTTSGTSRSSSTVQSLPAELTELILIFAALGGFPSAIAAFAQTCRAFRALVYHPADQHLWREVFLTTFDDPRADNDRSFHWGPEFRRRVWTANHIQRSSSDKADRTAAAACDAQALETLLAVVHTATPCPPTLVFSCVPAPARTLSFSLDFINVSFAAAAEPAYPIFPPRSSVAGSGSAAASLNIPWVEAVLKRGLPARLTGELSSLSWKGGPMHQALDEREMRMMQALGRVVCYTGFLPVPEESANHVAQDSNASSSIVSEEDEVKDGEERDGEAQDEGGAKAETARSAKSHEDTLVPALNMSVVAQQKRARRLARMRVYNMRYLTPHRHWGPFLSTDAPSRRRSGAGAHDELLVPILALFADAVAGGNAEEEEQPALPALADDESVESDSDGEESGADGIAEENGYVPPFVPPPAVPLPSTTELRPDWAYLAAARIVVETNLREAVGADEIAGLCALDGLRRGSAPKDVGTERDMGTLWTGEKAYLKEESKKGWQREKDGNEDKEEEERRVDDWDWAGVTGVWRRCVCWMDYRDLIMHNLSTEFSDNISEAVRIVPMRLHVASRSPCLVPGYADRPTLHVEGETSGSSPSGHVRRLHGTVGVVADGSVRWCLYSTVDGGDADEWVTEGLQVGGLNSAMGVLGMWTGAQHERMDPLGPFWAWKVG